MVLEKEIIKNITILVESIKQHASFFFSFSLCKMYMVLGVEPRASDLQGRYFTTETHPQHNRAMQQHLLNTYTRDMKLET